MLESKYKIYDSASNIITYAEDNNEPEGNMISSNATPEQQEEYNNFANTFVSLPPLNSTINPSNYGKNLYVYTKDSAKSMNLLSYNITDLNDFEGLNITKFLQNFEP